MPVTRKRKIIIGTAVSVALILVIVVSIFASHKDEPEVNTLKVETRPELRSTVVASGEVRPIQFINLTSEVAGRIEEIYVNPGDRVTKGQPLVRLDPTQLQSSQDAQLAGTQAAVSDVENARTQVIAAENAVAQAQQALFASESAVAEARQAAVSAQTNVDRTEVDLNAALRELKRTTELVEAGVSSRADYDSARDKYDQSKVALRTAQAQLQQQKIAVEEAIARANQQRVAVQDARTSVERSHESVKSSEARASQQQALLRGESSQRSKATQVAPLTGVVADIPARVGQFALANFSSTPLLTIADMTTINVEVNVDETEIAQVEVGQLAKVKVGAMGEKELQGVVKQKNPLAVGKSDTQDVGITNRVNVQEAKEFKVVIELQDLPDDMRDSLRPGMTADASITTKIKKNVFAIPLGAIVAKSSSPTPTPTVEGSAPTATPTPFDQPKETKGVYILQSGNKVKFVEITTGITGESDVEITSGLNSGDEILTGPTRVLRTLKDGASVKRQTRKPGNTGNTNANEAKS